MFLVDKKCFCFCCDFSVFPIAVRQFLLIILYFPSMPYTICTRGFSTQYKEARPNNASCFLECHAGQSSIKCVLLICDMNTSTFLLSAVRFQSVRASVFWWRAMSSLKSTKHQRGNLCRSSESYNLETLFLIICVFLIEPSRSCRKKVKIKFQPLWMRLCCDHKQHTLNES